MISSLKSSLFRFFRTKLFLLVLGFSAVMGMAMVNNTCSDLSMYFFARPRYFDSSFVVSCIRKLVFVIPFGSAVFCTMFTGSDISFRSINNKIATGTRRISIFFADAVTASLATIMSILGAVIVIYIFAKTVPVKESVKINSVMVESLFKVTVICVAFVILFTVFQYLLCNKLLAVMLSFVLLIVIVSSTSIIDDLLQRPYRYSYTNEETGETLWETNPGYVGGNARKALVLAKEVNPYYGAMTDDPEGSKAVTAAGASIIIFTAAGFVVINRKEFP